jgi:uncharacterized membrane protein YciS (DUF1049 family)
VPSRSALERAGVALGAVVEGVWCGALAAALSGSPWALLGAFAVVMVAAAAAVTRWAGAAPDRERAGRVAAAALGAVGIAALFGAGRAWTHDYLLWQVVRDAVFVSGVVLLGIRLGGGDLTPETAVGRAVRGFALLCAVLVCAAIAGSTPGWAAAAVVTALVAGGLLIAVMRYRSLTDLVAASDRLPSWPWLLAVTGALLCVVAIAALLGQLLDVDVLRWLLGAVAAVLSTALDATIYAVGWAGTWLVRALGWLLSLVHVRAPHLDLKPPPASRVKVVVPPYQPATPASSATRLVVTVAGALVAVVASLAVVAFAMRRLRRRAAVDEAVEEEREALGSLREAAGAFAGRLGQRLRRLASLGRREARSPAELVRLRYAQLEQRLTAAGRPRPPGVTVRDYLAQCAAAMEVPRPVADVAGLYELARYSAHAVDGAQARRFEELAQAIRPRAGGAR